MCCTQNREPNSKLETVTGCTFEHHECLSHENVVVVLGAVLSAKSSPHINVGFLAGGDTDFNVFSAKRPLHLYVGYSGVVIYLCT